MKSWVFDWLMDHPDVELTMFKTDYNYLVVEMLDRTNLARIKHALDPKTFEAFKDTDDCSFIFDHTYEKLKQQHKISIMMEEEND